MFTVDTDRDRQLADFAILDHCLDGVEDGYNGKPTQYTDQAYMQGYLQGMERRSTEDLAKIAYLRKMNHKADEILAGQCEWLNEILACNDEPWLAHECQIEEF